MKVVCGKISTRVFISREHAHPSWLELAMWPPGPSICPRP